MAKAGGRLPRGKAFEDEEKSLFAVLPMLQREMNLDVLLKELIKQKVLIEDDERVRRLATVPNKKGELIKIITNNISKGRFTSGAIWDLAKALEVTGHTQTHTALMANLKKETRHAGTARKMEDQFERSERKMERASRWRDK